MDFNSVDDHLRSVEEVENVPVDREVLHLLARHSQLQDYELKAAYQKVGLYPNKLVWFFWAQRFFMAAAALFALTAIVLLFNNGWDDIPRLVKLGLVQLPILGLGLFALRPNLSGFVRGLILGGLVFMVGVALSVYGLIYPTKATFYDFMIGWMLLATPFVVIADNPFLYLFYLLGLNITALSSLEIYNFDYRTITLFLALLDVAVVVYWLHRFKTSSKTWVDFLSVRILATAVLFFISINAFRGITSSDEWSDIVHILIYLMAVRAALKYQFKVMQDVYWVSIIAVSILIVGNTLIVRFLVELAPSYSLLGIFFILGFLNIGATILLVNGLVKLNKEWNKIENRL